MFSKYRILLLKRIWNFKRSQDRICSIYATWQLWTHRNHTPKNYLSVLWWISYLKRKERKNILFMILVVKSKQTTTHAGYHYKQSLKSQCIILIINVIIVELKYTVLTEKIDSKFPWNQLHEKFRETDFTKKNSWQVLNHKIDSFFIR